MRESERLTDGEIEDLIDACDRMSADWCARALRQQQAEIGELRHVCSESYLAVGVMANHLGWWRMAPDHPWSEPIEKLMDNLSSAAEGEPIPHADLLPFVPPKAAP